MRALMRFTMALPVVALLSIVGATQASASIDMVVVRSTGAPFERGTMIDGSVPLKLESGWSVTLVASDGSYVTMSGPSEQIPAEARNSSNGDPKILEVLRALLAAQERSTAALGVVRSADGEVQYTTLPDAWAVNTDRSGPRCIKSNVANLWRQDASSNASMSIMTAGNTRTARASWAAGRNMLPVSGASFSNGGTYIFETNGRRTRLTMYVMPTGLTGAAEQAAWMAQTGCEAQAIAMLEAIR